MKFELLKDQPTPGLLPFIWQTCLIAPAATFLIWSMASYLITALNVDNIVDVPFNMVDLADDVTAAGSIFASGLVAGTVLALIFPLFRPTGRWLFLIATLLVISSAFTFRHYVEYNSRGSWLLTSLGWGSDLALYPAHAFFGYSLGMLFESAHFWRKKGDNSNNEARWLRWLRLSWPLVAGFVILVVIGPIARIFVAHVAGGTGPIITIAEELRGNSKAILDNPYYQIHLGIPIGSHLSTVEEFLRKRGISFSFDASSNRLYALVGSSGVDLSVEDGTSILFSFDEVLNLTSIRATAIPTKSNGKHVKGDR